MVRPLRVRRGKPASPSRAWLADLPWRARAALVTAARHGLLVGVAFNAAYLLSWLSIALTGSPGETGLVMLGLVVQYVGLALAVASAMQGGRPDWRRLPLPALILLVNGVLLASLADVFAHVGGLHPAFAVAEAAALLLVGLVWLPLVLLVPAACAERSGFGQVLGRWLSGFRRIAPLARGRWLLEFIVLVGAWEAVQPAAGRVLAAVIPYPGLSSLAIGVVGILGWAVVAGRLLPTLAAAAASPGPAQPAGRRAVPGRLAERMPWPQVAAVGALGLGSLAALLSSPNLPLVVLLRAAVAQDQAGLVAGPIGQELRTLGFATAGIGDVEAATAVVAATDGDRSGADDQMAQAVWWAPQSSEVERARAWLEACSERGRGLGTQVVALDGIGDFAGAEQAQGLWAERSGQPSRQHLFAALELDPTVSLLMPDGVPAPAVTGTSGERRALAGLLQDERELAGSAVAWSVQHGSFTQAVALDDIAEGFYRDAPGPRMQPTFHHLVALAAAYAHLGEADLAVGALRTAFDQAPTTGDRQDVAAAALLAAVPSQENGLGRFGAGPIRPDDEIVQFVGDRGSASDHLALGLFYLSGSKPAQAADQFQQALASSPDRVTRARALAALALHDYIAGDYASAAGEARQSLDLRVPDTRAAAESVLGNSTLAAGFPASSPTAEADLRRSLAANPDAFMLWWTLARLEARRHDYRDALQDDVRALSAYQLVSSAGLGAYEGVVNPTSGIRYRFGSSMPTFVQSVDDDVRALQAQGS